MEYQIKKNSNGQFYVEFYNSDHRHRYTLKSATRADRTAEALAIIEKIRAGEKIDRKRETLNPKKKKTLADKLWKAYEHHVNGLSKSTQSHYKTVLSAFLDYMEKNPTEKVTPEYASAYLQSRSECAAGYQNKILSNLKTLFDVALHLELITKNPFKFLKRKRVAVNPPELIKPEDQKRILDEAKEKRTDVYLLLLLMRGAFIRPGEALKIKRKDVDRVREQIFVPADVSKNRIADYAVPNADTWNALKAYIDATDGDYNENDYLIAPQLKSRDTREYRKRYESITKRLGLSHYGFYAWKHTGICAMYDRYPNVREIQTACRHQSMDMTGVYLKASGRTETVVKREW